jgi:hypothetical protein
MTGWDAYTGIPFIPLFHRQAPFPRSLQFWLLTPQNDRAISRQSRLSRLSRPSRLSRLSRLKIETRRLIAGAYLMESGGDDGYFTTVIFPV